MIGVRKLRAGFLSCGLFIAFAGTAAYASGSGPGLTPDQAVDRLQQGNARFIAGESTHPNTGADRMADTTKNGQQPFATIITCSDSRVPVERLFDQGIGDTFVIRVAGNVCDVDEIGSIEYGVDHLATPVLVVLGHTNCGAVTAVVTGAELHGSIPLLVDNIKPAIERARKNHPHLRGKALVPEAVKANVWQSIDDLFKSSPATRKRVEGGKLKVVGALYDIGNGKVQWLGSHPEQGRLLAYTGGPSAEGGHGDVDAAGGGHGEAQAAGHTNEASAENEAAVAAMIRKLESNKTLAKHEKSVTSAGSGRMILYVFGGAVLLLTGGLVFFYARARDGQGNTNLRWTLGAKLIGGFSVIIIALTGMAIYSIDAMNGIGAEIEELAEEIIPLTDAVAMIEVDQLQQAVALERAFRFGEEEGAHAEEKFQESVERFEELAQKVDKELAEVLEFLEEVPVYDEEQAEVVAEAMNTLAKIEVEHAAFEALAEKAIELIGKDKHGQARLLEEHIEQMEDRLDHELEQYLITLQKRTETAAHNAEKDEQAAVTMMMGVAIASVIIGLCLAVWLTRSITKPINRIIAGLNVGADQVNGAAAQVSVASQQSAEGASEQASSLEETSAALEQMAAMTRTNAENAKQANELSGQARTAAEGGDKTMHRLNEAMAGISEASGQISKIIKVIEEIAFQTNLLALNAAVEAARAGEHGKGFAVVAEEVRNLAQRAAQAARETTGLIEDSTSKAKEGTDVAGEVGKALSAIVSDVTKVTDLVDRITKASEEQAQGVDQVNTAVSQMDKVTQQNAAGAEESAAAAEELSAQAQQVKGMVGELMALVNGGTTQAVTTATPNSPRRSTAGYAQKKPHITSASASAGGHQEESPRTGSGSSDDEFMALDSKGNKGLKEF